jgi:hypothetical protein
VAGKSFDSLLGHTGRGIDRKASFRIMAGSVVAIFASRAEASSAGGKKRAEETKRCRAQRSQCRAFVQNELCAPRQLESRLIAAPDTCIEQKSLCCDAFATCNLGKGLRCLMERSPAEPAEK